MMISKTRRQFQSFADNTEDAVHQTGRIMEKQYSNARESDQKQEMPIKQNHDKEVSDFGMHYTETRLIYSERYCIVFLLRYTHKRTLERFVSSKSIVVQK